MSKIPNTTVIRWRATIAEFMTSSYNKQICDVTTGATAWAIAHKVGITNEAYEDRTILDAHIQTVLEKIFVNAVFLDPKRY